MSTERMPQCTFETKKAFCEVSQNGENCYQFEMCYQRNINPGKDLTPAQFSEMNPYWPINLVLLLLEEHMEKNPKSTMPLRSEHERFSSGPLGLPIVYIPGIHDRLLRKQEEKQGKLRLT